jgi:hypothetical protein
MTRRLSEDDLRVLARLVRLAHARAAAKAERLRREQEEEAASRDTGGDS